MTAGKTDAPNAGWERKERTEPEFYLFRTAVKEKTDGDLERQVNTRGGTASETAGWVPQSKACMEY